MAVPYRRTSASKSRMRRAHHALTPVHSSNRNNCAEPVLSHHVCRACGFYRGKQVLGVSAVETAEA